MEDHIIVTFEIHKRARVVDLELPLDMTAMELVEGLNKAYVLGINLEDPAQCYMACQNPIALLKGMKTLREYGLHNGSVIHFTR